MLLTKLFLVMLSVLRSLSAVELSKHAIELEKRSIQLSLEEGNLRVHCVLLFSYNYHECIDILC